MPQYDLYHHEVKNALIKDGWTITDDPYTLEYKGIRLYADLGAEKLLAAEKEERKIVVEIKVFNSLSQITELQKAMGQYSMYQSILNRVSPDRKLFLGIAEEVYSDFFQKPAIQDIISDQNIHLMIFNPDQEVICQWLS